MAQPTQPIAPSHSDDPRRETAKTPKTDQELAQQKTPKTDQELAQQRADAIAASQFDPGAAARMEALEPSPVYHLPGQAQGNPGVQGWVFRPHQEPNPGEVSLTEPYQRTAFGDQVRLEKEAPQRDGARARGVAAAPAAGGHFRPQCGARGQARRDCGRGRRARGRAPGRRHPAAEGRRLGDSILSRRGCRGGAE